MAKQKQTVVGTVKSNPGSTATELADIMNRTPDSVSSYLTKLVQRKEVKRKLKNGMRKGVKAYRYY